MSIQGFIRGLEDLKASPPARAFTEYTGRWLTVLNSSQSFDKEKALTSYNGLNELYKQTMNSTAVFKRNIEERRTYSNQDEMDIIVAGVTEFEDQIAKIMTVYTDRLLDRCPTMKVDYGTPCIGPKTSPADSAMFNGAGQGPRGESQVRELQKFLRDYPYIREIRGDGNCFITAFITVYLEHCLKEGNIDELIILINNDITIIDSELKKEIIKTLEELKEFPNKKDSILGNNYKILPLIKYFRLSAADEMIKMREEYEPTFASDVETELERSIEGKSYETLVSECVAGMGIEFVDQSIKALYSRFLFPVKIIHYGRPDQFNLFDGVKPMAVLCRKGAHYFVVYEQEGASTGIPYHRKVELGKIGKNVFKGEPVFIFGKEHNRSIFGLTEREDESGWIREHWLPNGNPNVRGFYTEKPLSDVDYKPLLSEAPWDEKEYASFLPGEVSAREYENLIDRDWPGPGIWSDDIAEEGEGKEQTTRNDYVSQPTLMGHPYPPQTTTTTRNDYVSQPTLQATNTTTGSGFQPTPSMQARRERRERLASAARALTEEKGKQRPEKSFWLDDVAKEGEPKTTTTTPGSGYQPSRTMLERRRLASAAPAPLENNGQNENTITKKKGREQSKERFFLDASENPLRAQQDQEVDYKQKGWLGWLLGS